MLPPRSSRLLLFYRDCQHLNLHAFPTRRSSDLDLINEETRVVTLSHGGYAKSQPLDDYQAQRRGGMGRSATAVKDEDFVEDRKSTRLNSSHVAISYAVFCLKTKNTRHNTRRS